MTRSLRRPRNRALPMLGALCLVLLLSLPGCDSNPAYPATPAFGLIKISNSTATDIGTVRMRKSGSNDGAEIWSYNLLSTLPALPGYLVFTLQPFGGWAQLRVPPGTYDFFLQSSDESTFWVLPGIVVSQNQITDYTVD